MSNHEHIRKAKQKAIWDRIRAMRMLDGKETPPKPPGRWLTEADIEKEAKKL